MPRLCRLRLSSIGHDSARFDDVTLDFTDRQGRPTNSVLWLRNGGGKSSLLSLFFASVRPGRRDFLGQRADEKVRRIEDYVGPRDHGVVVCEWELDTDRSLFEDSGPKYLSGVFYERKEVDDDGQGEVATLYFATLVSATEPELTLDGLPLYGQQDNGKSRRTLSGFRRRLRQLDRQYPGLNVFVEDRNQRKFQEELASHGIDPEVFFYQIRMNEREGGVSERFSFAEDEDFVDFLLEMAFDQQYAQQIRDQLSTFRQEIVERNEQLKPELEYCQGLVARLHKLAGVFRERAEVFRQTRLARDGWSALLQWASTYVTDLTTEAERLKERLSESRAEADKAGQAADLARRLAGVQHREACRLRLRDAQAEYDRFDAERAAATRRKELWRAAVPLAKVWEARGAASRLRDLLQAKLREFAPDLEKLTAAATRFANALDHDLAAARRTGDVQRSEASQLRERAVRAREEAAAAGEDAAKDETLAQQIDRNVDRARQEEQILREQGVLKTGEATIADALARLAGELQEIELAAMEADNSLEEIGRQHRETRAALVDAQSERSKTGSERDRAQEAWNRAVAVRSALEADAVLLRLLQTDRVDMEAAATGATSKATDELRRVTDAILKIGIEAAEDERAIRELGDSGLLPPARDVESLLDWLRRRQVACWSGWKYIEENVSPQDRRALVQRLPHIASGIIVADPDYERLGDLFAAGDGDSAHRLRSPLVIAPAESITGQDGVPWLVVGPASDAHFDTQAGAGELARLLEHRSRRQRELEQHQQWQHALTDLKHRLQQYLLDYPRGWFSDRRQKLEILVSRLEEATLLVDRLTNKQGDLDGRADEVRQQLESLAQSRSQALRHRDRVQQFDRSLGRHLAEWTNNLELARHRARKNRLRQEAWKQEASDNEVRSQQATTQAEQSSQAALRLEAELSQVKHCEQAARRPEAGATEELRSRYQLLLADYEGKVNADSLSHLAADKDRDADKHDREFQRVMQQFPDISEDAVEAELRKLPQGLSAQEQLERADEDYDAAWRKLGPLTNRRDALADEYESAEKECDELAATAPLPAIPEADSADGLAARAAAARREADEQAERAKALDAEAAKLTDGLRQTTHEMEKIRRDQSRLESIRLSYQQQFDRLAVMPPDPFVPETPPSAPAKDSETLAARIGELEHRLSEIRQAHDSLDARRNKTAKEIAGWSREERFGTLRSSISHRFLERDASALEAKAELDIVQVTDRATQIEEKLKEADRQREVVVHVLSTAVDEALSLLKRVSRMSKLPDRLPQAGKQFLKIETKASNNPEERRGHVGELIDELLERGDVGDGLQLIQRAVRRVARRVTARVLHPDLHQKSERVSIADMRRFSGGERLTSAILLFCALLRLRQGEARQRNGSSVLVLDNPIGTASRLSFLEMQREVAGAMNVQLIYATAVNDLNAVGALENVIRLRNTRADRRTGRRFIEADPTADGTSREVDAVRMVFDTAASSNSEPDGSPRRRDRQTTEIKILNDERRV